MKKLNPEDFYGAVDAKSDSTAKDEQKNSYVDSGKIRFITESIKDKISAFSTQHSKDKNSLQREFNYDKNLSEGEIEFLQKLGYKVAFEVPDMAAPYYAISW